MQQPVVFQAAVFVVLISSILAVDRGNFKTCEQSSFCRYHVGCFCCTCVIDSWKFYYYGYNSFYGASA